MTSQLLNIDLNLKEHFQLIQSVFNSKEKCIKFYNGALKSETTLFNLIETLEKSIILLDRVLNGYEPEKERVLNPLPSNTYYNCHLYKDYIEIFDDLSDLNESIKINIDTYTSLLKALYHELLKNRYYKNGQLIFRDSYSNGKRHGKWSAWFENGQIEFIGQYENAIKINTWIYYYKNGQKQRVENYLTNGQRNGEQKSWWENGSEMCKENYENGFQEGLSQMWHDNGQLMNYKSYRKGKIEDGHYYHYDVKGNIEMTIIYEDGKDKEIVEHK